MEKIPVMTEASSPEVEKKEQRERLTPWEIMERAQERRRGILTKSIGRWGDELKTKVPKPAQVLLSTGFNYVGIPGAIKMVGEAVRGKTVTGQELTPLGRLNHGLIQGTNALAYYSAIRGEFKRAGIIYASSWALDGIQYYPEILKALGELSQKRNLPKLQRTFEFINTHLDRIGIRRLFFKPETSAGSDAVEDVPNRSEEEPPHAHDEE